MIARRVPRWTALAPLLRRAAGTRLERRLAAAASVDDVRQLARRRAPRSVFDYVDGGAGDEVSMRRARRAFERVEFHPRVLRDVSSVDTSTIILGKPASMPLILAPTGFTRMMHTAGESAVAAVAATAGVPYALSTMGTTTPEDVAAAAPAGRHWFQLYVWRDRGRSAEIVERAQRAGFDTLVLTVDVPVGGARLRDVRNGLTVPPTLTWRTFLDGARHPLWLFDFLTTDPPHFASLDATMPMAKIAATLFDASVGFDDLGWFRTIWNGPIVVKGVQRVDDARRLADAGVDAIVVSNHGGRQLDRARTPLELLPDVVAAVGERMEVYVDGGVRSGADIAAAVGLGARAVLAGRAYLYGLMAAGEAGVARVTDLLHADLQRTMQLLGITSIGGLGDGAVSFRAGEPGDAG